jgi:hypothetical protein
MTIHMVQVFSKLLMKYEGFVILVSLLCHNLPLLDQGPTPYIELSG